MLIPPLVDLYTWFSKYSIKAYLFDNKLFAKSHDKRLDRNSFKMNLIILEEAALLEAWSSSFFDSTKHSLFSKWNIEKITKSQNINFSLKFLDVCYRSTFFMRIFKLHINIIFNWKEFFNSTIPYRHHREKTNTRSN